MCLEYCPLKEAKNYFTDAFIWKYDRAMCGITSSIDETSSSRKGFTITVRSSGIVCLSAVGVDPQSKFVPRSVLLIKKRDGTKFQVFDYGFSHSGQQTTIEAFLSVGTWLLIVSSFPGESVGVKAYCKPGSLVMGLASQEQFSIEDLWKNSMTDMVQTAFKDKDFGEIEDGGREVLYYRNKYDQGGFHVELWKNPTGRELTVSKRIGALEDIKINVLGCEFFDPSDSRILKFKVPGSGQRVVVYEITGPRQNIEFGDLKLE